MIYNDYYISLGLYYYKYKRVIVFIIFKRFVFFKCKYMQK